MRGRLASALACLIVLPGGAARAADPPPGASSCSGCHAASADLKTAIPSLAGQSPAAIAGIMREFKSGARPATVMGRIARGFSDAETDAIAGWLGRHD